MRIGLFSDTYLPDINGVVSSIVTLQKELEKKGHEVFVIANHKELLHSTREGNVLRLPGIELKWLYGYVMSSPYHFSAKDEIKKMNLDIIHVHTEFGIGIFARLIARELGIPIVCTYHTMYEDYTHYVNKFEIDEIEKFSKKMASSFSKMVTDGCEGVIAPSEKTKEILIKYGVDVPIHIIPTGLDLEKFNADNVSEELKQGIRDEFKIAAEDKVMLYVGRIAEEKSIDLVIRGFKKAALSNPHYKLMIVGGGPQSNELIKLANDLEIASSVIFTGKQERERIPAFYAFADGFVSASLSETQGMTFIEALSSGLPVFARKDDVLIDLIDEGQSGYYFVEEDFSDKVMAYFALSDEAVLKMKEYAKMKVQKYDGDTFYHSVMGVYHEAIASYHQYLDVVKIKPSDDCVYVTLKDNDDEEYKILMSVEDYFIFEIKKDGTVHRSVLEELLEREKTLKAWRMCVRKLAIKDRTRKEMYDILIEDNTLDIADINDMIERLEEKGYLNDDLYLLNQIEKYQNSTEGKNKSIRALVKKGLPYEKVSEAFEALDDVSEKSKALRYAEKLKNTIRDKSLKMKKQLMKQRLISHGFNPGIANEVVDSLDYQQEMDEEKEVLRKAIEKAAKTNSRKYQGEELKHAILRTLIRKGFSSEEVLIVLNEMEILNDEEN